MGSSLSITKELFTEILSQVYIHLKSLENIFICGNNTVKLIDLGLSRQMLCRGNLPIQKILVGTPYFMAPEVI